MACKNEQCRCRGFCEVKSSEDVVYQKCEQHKIIAIWWHESDDEDEDPEDDEEEQE